MTRRALSVAAPWSLSHYIPLNGFHPLYRALFDHAPDTIALSAWDNVKLYRRFRSDRSIRNTLLRNAEVEKDRSDQFAKDSVTKKYHEYFWAPNQILTTELMGDIEFHHTAPFPSLTRPFVFHCESFAPVLFPFAQQGSGSIEDTTEIREHYRSIFADPLCLGIFSHIPETLQTFNLFFSDPVINRKLFPSKIGLSEKSFCGFEQLQKPQLSRPQFLFVNSANQNPMNFFRRGGHLVLRFWNEFITSGRHGLLVLRCAKPTDEDLSEYGVDVSMIRNEMGRSIIWAEDYLANHEMNALIASSHFFLLPSASLHSVSIMQSMLLGTIPVVSDTVGTDVYIQDNDNGIVLQGMRKAIWYKNESTGILIDRYCRTPDLDVSLVSQMTRRLCALLDAPKVYWEMRTHTLQHVRENFSGQIFPQEFWSKTSELYEPFSRTSDFNSNHAGSALVECTIQGDGWARVFESPTQPMLRINMGQSVVWELGGAMIHSYGMHGIGLNDWSVLARYFKSGAPQTTFANSLEELGGKYLHVIDGRVGKAKLVAIGWIARILRPYPALYRFVANVYSKFRRFRVFRFAEPNADPNIELVCQGVSGYNIIRHVDQYYAIRQDEGEFILEKAESGGYSSSFSGFSVDQVLRKIEESILSSNSFDSNNDDLRTDTPILERFHGFDIVRKGKKFHAILQNEEAGIHREQSFDEFSASFSGFSIEEVQEEILSALNADSVRAFTNEKIGDQVKRLRQGP